MRAAEYLTSCPEPEPSGVNKFLKELGKTVPPPKKGKRSFGQFMATDCCAFREQNEVLAKEVSGFISLAGEDMYQARRRTYRRDVSQRKLTSWVEPRSSLD